MSKLISPGYSISRRKFVLGASAAVAGGGLSLTQRATSQEKLSSRTFNDDAPVLSGTNFDLVIDYQTVNFTGSQRRAITVNGSLPAPTLRWKQGETVTINITNKLDVDSSLHWHGIILPTEMDGVPGLSFDGIKPGETFTYRFKVQQSGTYWYHSHSAFQEQLGLFGGIIIDPSDDEAQEPSSTDADRRYDREHLLLLSDWSDENPHKIYAKLKKLSHYYNTQERTLSDTYNDVKRQGLGATLRNRSMWNRMRMSDTDISDVTGYTYTYLTNGYTPEAGWTGRFFPGEKVLLRIVNASAMTIFDFRIPGLTLKIIAADGQAVKSFDVDEFRIGVAETYDVIIEPKQEAYTLFSQSIDRSGFTRGTLTSNANISALIPAMDKAPVLSHRDMGMMNHSKMSNDQKISTTKSNRKMNREENEKSNNAMDRNKMDHSAMINGNETTHQSMKTDNTALGLAGFGSIQKTVHDENEFGPHVDMRVDAPMNGLNDPGIGLRDHQRLHGRRVLSYKDLKNYYPSKDKRQPTREIHLHLTGNMNRYMWSINGVKFSDAPPITINHNERVRFVLTNDTMMTHPIHLHGLWSELETGDPEFLPRKHTILVQPGSMISYLVTANALGRWAYHCHLLFHMAGMMREVSVVSTGNNSEKTLNTATDMEMEMENGGHNHEH